MLTKAISVACRNYLIFRVVAAVDNRIYRWLEDDRLYRWLEDSSLTDGSNTRSRRMAAKTHDLLEDASNAAINRAFIVGNKRHRRREAGEGHLSIFVARAGTRVGLGLATWSARRLSYWNPRRMIVESAADALTPSRITAASWDKGVAWFESLRRAAVEMEEG